MTVVLFAVGLYLAFFVAPPDYQQGETVKIMFIHVPSAWLAMMGYTLIADIGHRLARLAPSPCRRIGQGRRARSAPAFTLLALITGSLWGKPMWGTYWVWDARLTSVLVLFFLYLGLIALWQAIDEPSRAGRAAAILALVGSINVPIIKFSVDWWNTLHQPASLTRLDAPAIHPSILTPLLVMALAFTCLFFVLYLKAMKTEILRRRVEALRIAQVSERGGGVGTMGGLGQHAGFIVSGLRRRRRRARRPDRLDHRRRAPAGAVAGRVGSRRHHAALRESQGKTAMSSATGTRKSARGKPPAGPSQRGLIGMFLPLGIFLGLAALFVVGLYSGDPSKLPSALIGKPVPKLTLPPLEGLLRDGAPVPGFSDADLAKGEPSIVNVWASWCIPCIQEHPFLVKLAEQSGAPLYGINEKDTTTAARRFLGRYGNPYKAVGVDRFRKGRRSIGESTACPETFIVGGDGTDSLQTCRPDRRRGCG